VLLMSYWVLQGLLHKRGEEGKKCGSPPQKCKDPWGDRCKRGGGKREKKGETNPLHGRRAKLLEVSSLMLKLKKGPALKENPPTLKPGTQDRRGLTEKLQATGSLAT